MNKVEREEYLDKWGTQCFICKQEVQRPDMFLKKSIVELEKYPDHAEPEVVHWYMVCPKCIDKGELV